MLCCDRITTNLVLRIQNSFPSRGTQHQALRTLLPIMTPCSKFARISANITSSYHKYLSSILVQFVLTDGLPTEQTTFSLNLCL